MNPILFAFCMALANALWPVKDFRVASLDAPDSRRLVVKENDILPASATAALISTTNSLDVSAPTVTLADDIQMVWTDDSRSISYLNVSVFNSKSGYNETFAMLLDTGSPLSWIYNESCADNACQESAVKKFDDFSSPLDIAGGFTLSYSGQQVSGNVINAHNNNITLNLNQLALANFSFGLASQSPEMFNGFDVSGIIGIPSAQSQDRNIITQLYETKVIDSRMFSFSLVSSSQTIKYTDENNYTLSLPSNYGGLIIFGSKAVQYQTEFVRNDTTIHYVDVIDNSNGYWLIGISDVYVTDAGQTSPFNSSDSTRRVIIDTGTTGMVLSLQDADHLHELLFGDALVTDNKGNYAFPCSNNDSSFAVTIDNHNFTVNVNDFKGKQYTNQGLQGYCASMIQGIDEYKTWVFGAAFLSKFYTVFDLEQKRIGFGDCRVSSYSLQQASSNDRQGAVASINGYSNTTTSHAASSASTTALETATSDVSASTENSGASGPVVFSTIWVFLACFFL